MSSDCGCPPAAVSVVEPVGDTGEGDNHFFGYYDKHQWSPDNRYILAHSAAFCDRHPYADDRADVLLIDTRRGFESRVISQTCSWCIQQGSMLQWLPGHESTVVHNERIGDRFVCIVLDTETGKRRVLPRPIYTVNSAGSQALSLNFSRLDVTRPGYGYAGLPDFRSDHNAPEDDGIYLMDMDTGEHRLTVSVAQLVHTGLEDADPGAKHYFNHLLFNPSGDRFIFLHRWTSDGKSFQTRLCTAGKDGSDIFVSTVKRGSHFIWYDNKRIIIWAHSERFGAAYHIVEDGTDRQEVIGSAVLKQDGHVTLSPGGKWLLTDERAKGESAKDVLLFDMAGGERIKIARFPLPPQRVGGEVRCDLHPRWDRSGTNVCVDAMKGEKRQMYLIDVSGIVEDGQMNL